MISEKYKQRFSQLLLDDSDLYVYKTSVQCNPDTEGLVHISSASVILEPFSNDLPVTQYFYKDMKNIPRQDPDFPSTIIFSICAFKVLPDSTNSFISRAETCTIREISFQPLYESPNKIVETILIYYTRAKNNKWRVSSKEILETLKSRIKFDYNFIVSIKEKFSLREAIFTHQIKPLQKNPGWIMVTDMRVYFQNILAVEGSQLLILELNKISSIYKRRWMFQSVALELFTAANAYLLKFSSEKIRDQVFSAISKHLTEDSKNEIKLADMMTKWQQRQISNYEYLLYLNLMANRTFNDFSQYPVFPWVLCDYTSNSIDLNDPKVFRDLSKPIGALNLERLSHLKSQLFDDSKFVYNSHYSYPSMITRWLVRQYPSMELAQNKGKFPSSSKVFCSVSEDWNSCSLALNDFRELIPEFYSSDSRFLLNFKGIELGSKPNKEKITHVGLPPWAKDPENFLQIMRNALESEYVSKNLHNWIDLIFGKNQRGELAQESNNVFCNLAYDGFFDLETCADLEIKAKNEKFIQEYGQVPKQLLKFGHPPRSEIPAVPDIHRSNPVNWDADIILLKPSISINEFQVHSKRVTSLQKIENKLISTGWDGVVQISDSKRIVLEKGINYSSVQHNTHLYSAISSKVVVCNLSIGQFIYQFVAHEDRLSGIKCLEPNLLLSSSWDQSLKLWDTRSQLKPVFIYENNREISCLSNNPANPYIVFTGDMSGYLKTVDLRKGLINELKCSEFIFEICSTPTGELVCGTLATQLYRNNELVSSINLPGVQSVATDGKFAFFGKEEESLQLWDISSQSYLYNWDEICNICSVLCDGLEIYAGSIEGTIYKIG